MYLFQACHANQPLRDAALIRNHDNAKVGLVEQCNAVGYAW
jgi:hypothetical protein